MVTNCPFFHKHRLELSNTAFSYKALQSRPGEHVSHRWQQGYQTSYEVPAAGTSPAPLLPPSGPAAAVVAAAPVASGGSTTEAAKLRGTFVRHKVE